MTQFGIETRDEGVGVVTPQGRLNMVSARHLREVLVGLVGRGTTRRSPPALIGGLKTARQAGGDLRVVRVSPAVLSVFELTNLDRILRPRTSVDTAFDD
jgi:anti-sigma B factor antagonist